MTALDERSASGETLLEVVISIAMLGLVFAALLGAVMTTTRASDLHRLQSDGDTQILTAAEQIKAATYVDTCATSTAATPLYPVVLASGWTLTDQDVTYWNGTTFTATCYDNLHIGLSLQQIQLEVSSADGRASRSVTLAKRG